MIFVACSCDYAMTCVLAVNVFQVLELIKCCFVLGDTFENQYDKNYDSTNYDNEDDDNNKIDYSAPGMLHYTT